MASQSLDSWGVIRVNGNRYLLVHFREPQGHSSPALRGLLSLFSWSPAGHELPNIFHLSRHSLAGSTHPAPSFPPQVWQIRPREQYQRRGSVLATLTGQKGAGDPKMTGSSSLCFPHHMWLAIRDSEGPGMLPIAPPLCRWLSPFGRRLPFLVGDRRQHAGVDGCGTKLNA